MIHITSQVKTRHSENDNTPQHLDQWTNSPFIGQQVGNCKVSHWPITWPIYLPCTVAKVNPIVHPISYPTHIPFHSKWVNPPIPELQQFQNLTFKIQVQGHGRGERWKSQHGSNIQSTHIPLIPCQSAIPFLWYDFSKIWPWKSKVKHKWPWWCTTTGLDNSIELQMV